MGTDAADINNDGLIDLMKWTWLHKTTEGKKRIWPVNRLFWSTVNAGFHISMYNTLQLNEG